MLNEEDPVQPRYRLEGPPAEPRPGLPSPRLIFTGRFRAGQAPEVLVAALPACRAAGLPAAAARSKSADHLPPPQHLLPGTAGTEGANRPGLTPSA